MLEEPLLISLFKKIQWFLLSILVEEVIYKRMQLSYWVWSELVAIGTSIQQSCSYHPTAILFQLCKFNKLIDNRVHWNHYTSNLYRNSSIKTKNKEKLTWKKRRRKNHWLVSIWKWITEIQNGGIIIWWRDKTKI